MCVRVGKARSPDAPTLYVSSSLLRLVCQTFLVVRRGAHPRAEISHRTQRGDVNGLLDTAPSLRSEGREFFADITTLAIEGHAARSKTTPAAQRTVCRADALGPVGESGSRSFGAAEACWSLTSSEWGSAPARIWSWASLCFSAFVGSRGRRCNSSLLGVWARRGRRPWWPTRVGRSTCQLAHRSMLGSCSSAGSAQTTR
jgi:hypothetical protein